MILLKVFLLFVILVGMIVVLLSVRLLTRPGEMTDTGATDSLRREVESEDRVIGDESVFHGFLARSQASRHRNAR